MRLYYIGLGLVQGWLWSFFLSGPLLFALGNQAEKILVCFLFFNSFAYLLTARAAIRYSPIFKRRVLLFAGGLLASIGPLLVSYFSAESSSLPLPAMVITAASLSGFGGALLVTAWGELSSRLPVRVAGLSFAGSVILGTMLLFLCSMLDNLPALLLLASFPLLSLLLLYLASRSIDSTLDHPMPLPDFSFKKWEFPIPTKLVVVLILYYLASGFVYKLLSMRWPFSSQETYFLTNTVYCGVTLLAGLCIYFIRDIDLRYLYRPVLPLLGAGFLLFPLFSNAFQHLSFILFQAGFALFDTYTWLLFIYLGSRHRYPALVVGSGFFLITLSILSGELTTTLIIPTLSVTTHDLNLVSLLAALMMMLATMVFQGQKETFAGWETPFVHSDLLTAELETAANPEDVNRETGNSSLETEKLPLTGSFESEVFSQYPSYPANCDLVEQVEKQPDPVRLFDSFSLLEQVDRLTRSYSLTKRENEVLLMLLQGRNNPFIREQLNISNNTLKTHLRNLYNKLSVKNRQELLNLFIIIDGHPVDPSSAFPIH